MGERVWVEVGGREGMSGREGVGGGDELERGCGWRVGGREPFQFHEDVTSVCL